MSAAVLKAGVVGWPVKHSLSPLIHGYWIAQYGLSGSYGLVEAPPERLAETVSGLVRQGWSGFNITLPHKQAVMNLCATIDPVAQHIGAVNTVAVRDGVLHGMNTDAAGFIESVRESLPDFDFTAGPVLVLGAGGAARAVVDGLRQAGAKDIRVANRTKSRAEAMVNVSAIAWDEREKAAHDVRLLVNTTALGMTGQENLAFDVAALPSGAAVCDIVYRPRVTALLRDAAALGHPVVDGLGMLLHQARLAFREWTGILPEIDERLRCKLDEALA